VIRRVLLAPVAGRTWREFAYVLACLPLAVPAFALALVGAVASALSLLTVGLPVLVAALALARPVTAAFRLPARIVGWHWPPPTPLPAGGPLGRSRALLRDGAAWRALLYCVVKLPVTVLAGYLAVVGAAIAVVFLTYPLWWFVTPTGFGGLGDHGWADTWRYALQAAGVLLVWPWLLRLLVGLDRVLVRALLEPSQDRVRIAELRAGRAALAADAVTVLRRLERDLHDGTQARLVSLGVALGRIGHRVTDPQVRELVTGAQETVTDALAELRDIVRGIHPPALDAGLATAVTTMAARSAVPTETTVELTAEPSQATASTLYFALAELLTNVTRHAGATRVRLRLAEDDQGYLLAVTDDGHGGATPHGSGPTGTGPTGTGPTGGTGTGGTGLVGLARRAAALDGTLRIDSPPGGPTTVTMTLPRED
jgi:signal transduction histidine kinase